MPTSTLTLACGPYIDPLALWVIAVIFLLLKPLAYYAFIQAFRYRVSANLPMSFRRAFGLTFARMGFGVAIFGGGWMMTRYVPNDIAVIGTWVYLYGARLAAWWVVGKFGARLRGRRLIGWTISGTLINVTFDVAVVFGVFAGPWPASAFVAGILAFLVPLHVIGRRASLRARFGAIVCLRCQYDLTGNLSGICPECGEPVRNAPARVAAAA